MGSATRAGVVLVGATNHPERVDPALRRSGRLDRTITLTLPGPADLVAMLRFHLGADLPDADLASLVACLPPSSAADAAKWVRDARGLARDAGRPLVVADLAAQVRKPETRSHDLLLATARHEAAHAVVAGVLGERTVKFVTLTSGPGHDGLAMFEAAGPFRTRESLENDVVGILAGRAADEVLAEADTGAGGHGGSDLALATRTLVAIRASYGLGGDGLAYLGGPADAIDLVRDDRDLRKAVEEDLRRLYVVARNLVTLHVPEIEAVAAALVERGTLSGDEVSRIARAASDAVQVGGTA